MKAHRHLFTLLAGAAAVAGLAGWLRAADLKIRPLTLDLEGRFWVYRNGPAQPLMPYSPYAWMSDSTNLSSLIHMDLECRDHPNMVFRTPSASEPERCIRVVLNWDDATWASVAFISGPDRPAWWGDSNSGRYYNLNGLVKKKLVFYARGEHGDEVIKAQLGTLAGKPFGDSLKQPIVSDEIKLTQDWMRHEIDLGSEPSAELSRICCGFGFLVERSAQSGTVTNTTFYIDDVYFE